MYEGRIFRPPSEAQSLILQVTVGCRHNACTFCSMYKDKRFRIKTRAEIAGIIAGFKHNFPFTERIFLADGDALAVDTELLVDILTELYREFPKLKRVSMYAGPKDILAKSEAELATLVKQGLGMVYSGVESGSAQVLKAINKGVTPDEMIAAGKKAISSGLKLSVTVITGLGGKALWQEHALETARVVSAINPDYLGALTLMIEPNTLLAREIENGKFQLLSPLECLAEVGLMLKHLQVDSCVFRSNHASNYLPLKGDLPQDREMLLNSIAAILTNNQVERLIPENWRGL